MMKPLLLLLAALAPHASQQRPNDQPTPDPPYINGYTFALRNMSGQHDVKLSWLPTLGYGYRIYRSQDGIPGYLYNKQQLDTYGEFLDKFVKNYHTYTYYVTAVQDGVESVPSNLLTFTIPPPGRE